MKVTNRRWFIAITIFPTIAILASPRRAEAGFIAGNLGSNSSYSMTSGYTLSGPKSSSGLGYSLAVEFQVSGTSNIAFGSAELALEHHTGTNPLSVLLEADNNGVPGLTIETLQASTIPTGPSLVTVTSSINPVLNAGTNYWLVAVATNDTYLSWMANSQAQTSHLAYRTDDGSGPSGWSTPSGIADPAFAINSVVVPAPPSLGLLGIGLATFAGNGLRRRFPRRRARA